MNNVYVINIIYIYIYIYIYTHIYVYIHIYIPIENLGKIKTKKNRLLVTEYDPLNMTHWIWPTEYDPLTGHGCE